MAENIRLYAMRSFYAAREGLVTLDDDVLSIVAQVKEEYDGRITIEVDPDTHEYFFIEHCEDGTDRLIFATSVLDPRALDRLHRADSQGRAYEDPYDAAEREQDERQRLLDEAKREQVREHGENLAWALKRDGVMPRLPQQVFIPEGVRSVDARRSR